MFASSIGSPGHGDSIRIIHKALDAGINFVDTADAYGDSEEIVGKALKQRRDNVVLATKVSRPMGDDPNQQGTSRRWIMKAVVNPCAACRPTTSTSTRSTDSTPPPISRRPSPL
jgi:aryl-alcohol dehydrogenase-like predicted oxidoreductase